VASPVRRRVPFSFPEVLAARLAASGNPRCKGKGGPAIGPNHVAMPVTDDEIRHKYLDRAIREINALNHEVLDDERWEASDVLPVVGSGHPQADIMLLKHHASAEELEAGVAFYGRAGTAVLKSLTRLGIDPTTIYGTLCDKSPDGDDDDPRQDEWLRAEFAIVQPRIVVVMGDDALDRLNALGLPLAQPIRDLPGIVQRLTPSCEALLTPAIDDALDELQAKQTFWSAFRELGTWHASLPPY